MAQYKTYFTLQSWAGITCHPVTIVGETPKKYRVRLEEETRMPNGKLYKAGDTVLVPKYAIRYPGN